MNNKIWTAHVGISVIKDIPQREELFGIHPNPSHFFREGEFDINLWTCSVDNPVNPIDVTKGFEKTEVDENGDEFTILDTAWSTEALIELLMTHDTEQGVLMTSSQATAVYNVLKPEVIEEGMV